MSDARDNKAVDADAELVSVRGHNKTLRCRPAIGVPSWLKGRLSVGGIDCEAARSRALAGRGHNTPPSHRSIQ
jgi:hypothetical protein